MNGRRKFTNLTAVAALTSLALLASCGEDQPTDPTVLATGATAAAKGGNGNGGGNGGGGGGGGSSGQADPAIAFEAGDLRVMNASGAHEAVVFSEGSFIGNPTWSPTGSQIAFSFINFDVRTIDITIGPDGEPQGGPAVRLVDQSFGLSRPAWSPAGNEIALQGTGSINGPTESEPGSIWVIQADGSGLTRLYDAPAGKEALDPAWSPDGTRLAFVERDSGGISVIKVIARSTGIVEATLLAGQFSAIRRPDWQRTVGAAAIAFQARAFGPRPKDTNYRVYTLDTTAGPAATPTEIIAGSFPSWSPDDQELLFRSDKGKVQIITLGTGQIRTIRGPTGGFHLDWRR